MGNQEKPPREPDWTAYAVDACQSLIDASMFWDNELEEKVPLLKRARTMAGLAMRGYKETLRSEPSPLARKDELQKGC